MSKKLNGFPAYTNYKPVVGKSRSSTSNDHPNLNRATQNGHPQSSSSSSSANYSISNSQPIPMTNGNRSSSPTPSDSDSSTSSSPESSLPFHNRIPWKENTFYVDSLRTAVYRTIDPKDISLSRRIPTSNLTKELYPNVIGIASANEEPEPDCTQQMDFLKQVFSVPPKEQF